MQSVSTPSSTPTDSGSRSNYSKRKKGFQSSKIIPYPEFQQQVFTESHSSRSSSRRSAPRLVLYCLAASLVSAFYVTVSTRNLSSFQPYYERDALDFIPNAPIKQSATNNNKKNYNEKSDISRRLKRTIRIPTQVSKEYYNALRIASVTKEVEAASYDDKEQKEKPLRHILYSACCGLGHRLKRQAAAFRAAKMMGAPHLWVKWGRNCKVASVKTGSKIDLFDLLFGSGPMVFDEDASEATTNLSPSQSLEGTALTITTGNTTLQERAKNGINTREKRKNKKLSTFLRRRYEAVSKGLRTNGTIPFLNGAPGFNFKCPGRNLTREIVLNNAISDLKFYEQLRSLFRFNDKIEYFAQKMHRFSERITVGIHIRTGNGEKGDFQKKKRGFEDLDQWLVNMVELIHQLSLRIESAAVAKANATDGHDYEHPHELRPLIFVATDDPSAVEKIAAAANPLNISAVAFPQLRLGNGTGVTYNAKFDSSNNCLASWASQFIDASLLGATDVMIAGRYSSFSQSLPLTSIFSDSIVAAAAAATKKQTGGNVIANTTSAAKNASRFANRMFCEANHPGDGMRCYDDYVDWATNENMIYFTSAGQDWNSNRPLKVFHRKEIYLPCNEDKR
eukprot:jgi/Psemu1/28122/gm1.28122_g